MTDYSNGLIYKIVCRDENDTEIYYGSTVNFISRQSHHKSSCTNPNDKEYHTNKYKFMREHGGWENWHMIFIKNFPCETLQELKIEEQKYITEGGNLNKNNSYNTEEDRKANKIIYQKTYRNKQKLLKLNKK